MTRYENADIDLAPRLTLSRDGKMTGPFLIETSRQAGEISRVNETRRPRAHRSKTSSSSIPKVAPRSHSAGTSPNGIDWDLALPTARTTPSMSRGSTTYSNGVTTKPIGDISSKVNAWNFDISTDLTSISSKGQTGWDSNSISPTEKRPSLSQNKGESLSTLRERERNQTVGTIGDSGPSFGSLNWSFPSGQAVRKQLSPEVSPVQRQRCLTFEPAVSNAGHGSGDRVRSGQLPFGASGNDAEKNVRDIVNSVVDDDEQTDFAGYNGSLPHTRRSSGHQISTNDTQNAFSAISTRPSSLYTSSSRTESASSVTTMSPSHSRFSGGNMEPLDSPSTNGNRSNMFRSEAHYDGLFSSLSKLSLGDRAHAVDCDSLESTYYREPMYRERPSWQAPPHSQSGLPNISSRRTSSSHAMLGLRSPVLEEFRHDRVKKWELRDIFGHVVEFSGDQHGSRFIQQKMEVATSDERQRVFEEILPNARQLMQDVFGNYVCQKFFEHGHQIQKQILAKQIEGHVLNLSLGMYGCRVVQKALEHVLVQQQIALISELDGHVLRCVRDQNANHVIQRAIERCPPDSVEFIVRTFHGQVYALSGHPYGCRVLQRIFEHSPESQTRRLLEELHQHVENLVIDQYGNYVIQHVIANGQEADRRAIFSKLYGQIVVLSKHKFASNVIEKCIMYGTPETQYRFVTEFVSPTSEGSSPLFGLINDRFGNYVVQKMLDEGRGEARQLLVEAIRPQLPDLRRYGFGRHLSAIERSVMETPSYGEIWSHMNNESTWARGHNVYG